MNAYSAQAVKPYKARRSGLWGNVQAPKPFGVISLEVGEPHYSWILDEWRLQGGIRKTVDDIDRTTASVSSSQKLVIPRYGVIMAILIKQYCIINVDFTVGMIRNILNRGMCSSG
jgi:hypothetical protein